jgi:geranylgeranyl diphosphate synthase, type II
MAAATTLKDFLRGAAEQTDAHLKAILDGLAECPPKLREAMAYSLLGPGKRVRPALVLLCCQAAGGGTAEMETAKAPAAAIEMIHCFSLIHDDLPAMDDDDLRRGRPTNHKVYGEALAILAGDALNTLPFEIVARVKPPALAATLVLELAQATGAEGMIGGQVLDTCHPEEAKAGVGGATLTKLQQIHRMKTGALIRCACRMGGLCAGGGGAGGGAGAKLEAIDTYGRAIGLAFQIVDDILDVTATAEQMGKKTGKDAAEGKLTYPSLVGLEKAKDYLAEQVKIADDMAARLGSQARLLSELAHELASRTH